VLTKQLEVVDLEVASGGEFLVGGTNLLSNYPPSFIGRELRTAVPYGHGYHQQ
jgi:hypothetical protein